jgi:hypothetical protein
MTDIKNFLENSVYYPACEVSINPGLSFGGNFGNYHELFMGVITSSGKLPQYQFYDDQCADEFHQLIKHYNVINEYSCYRVYHWSIHFRLAELCGINKFQLANVRRNNHHILKIF